MVTLKVEVLKECPKCGKNLHFIAQETKKRTMTFYYCMNLKCRYAEVRYIE